MKTIFFAFVMLWSASAAAQQPLNSVIGDKGWETSCAMMPRPTEKEKIAGHLRYVENFLRANCPAGLDGTRHANRLRLLEALHAYSTAGNFPANEDFPGERRPHFIDNSGNICAVGYLVEVSAGRGMAERLNAKFSYSRIAEMQDETLAEWMRANGLTAKECAMIQPEYYWSGGPSLKDQPVDSLAPMVLRALRYTGKPDSCVIAFTITERGELKDEKVKSGSPALGKAVIAAMSGLAYTAQWSHGMGDPRQTSSSAIELTFYHGIAPPPVPADVYNYESIKTSNAVRAGGNDTNIRLTGRVNWKNYTYGVGNVDVRAFDSKGLLLGSTKTDANGQFSFSVKKGDYTKIRLELDIYGGKKVIVTGIPAENADMNAPMLSEEMFDRTPCNDFFCRTKFYLAAPPVPDPE